MSNVTGITAVGHDSESTISIPKCPEAGCYSRPIVYTNATIRQLRALAEISSECYQSIKVRIRHQFLIITSPRSPHLLSYIISIILSSTGFVIHFLIHALRPTSHPATLSNNKIRSKQRCIKIFWWGLAYFIIICIGELCRSAFHVE
jgi:hypothetical protein